MVVQRVWVVRLTSSSCWSIGYCIVVPAAMYAAVYFRGMPHDVIANFGTFAGVLGKTQQRRIRYGENQQKLDGRIDETDLPSPSRYDLVYLVCTTRVICVCYQSTDDEFNLECLFIPLKLLSNVEF